MARPTDSSIVAKCARIMDVLTHAKRPMVFSDIVAQTGFVKSSCHRVLAVLQSEGLVEYEKTGRTYKPGPRFQAWARAGFRHPDLQQVVAEPVDRLSEVTGMNIALSVLDGDTILYLRTSNHVAIRYAARTGDHAPLHCTAAGKVFLAFMTEKQRNSVLGSSGLEKFTEFTRTHLPELEADLDVVRSQGYAMVVKEEFLQVMGMSVPIWNEQGKVAACLSMWTLTAENTPDELRANLNLLKQTAAEICDQIGGEAPENFGLTT
ncbi:MULTISPECIES: IclR family transcriptional regulator [unclassified Ruegeria]|uniref:IclR family transcriptional regulator n=1 Tax=unclassified Ruegeria TaxID=2625375 RepID=UPI001488E6AE|nr:MULTISPECIES: IclR family transcriptional regulator [unclassified Ruegeria]NOD76114.1 helix-turn-helix domain-containing protein [Ruegeria sp. HKCCD4332]NOD90073.1 helix-turn-helix domain-containing protein [Ruegeria sp. HKCCD4318]NOE15146.1 helix-turn-helix domain-containing protein [Ruegeria sp. HKCCD4318-2]NOG10643.1 IclR family transcriptional regulator [Ruegeria sp. HKCCD4315]